MPEPRGTVHWPLAADQRRLPTTPNAVVIGPQDTPAEVIAQTLAMGVSGRRPSDSPLQPNADPHPWRGVGPYGHGGAA